MVLKKGTLVRVRFAPGVRFGIIVSTEIFNAAFHRYYFVSADKRQAEQGMEVQAVINGETYAYSRNIAVGERYHGNHDRR